MALPISGSQFDKLGVRLRDASVIAIDDLDLLERVLGSYDDALTEVSDVLHTLGYEPTTRLKPRRRCSTSCDGRPA